MSYAPADTLRMLVDLSMLIVALALLILAWRLWHRPSGAPAEPTAGAEIDGAAVQPRRPMPRASEPGWLPVLGAPQLLASVGATTSLAHMVRQSNLAPETWSRDLLPAIHRYAEFVQLMPASEAHHHAHAGGLLSHTLEMLLAALTWRNGYLLPQGATAEDLDAHRDHWTYAVFFAALLHDVGKPLTDLRITWRRLGRLEAMRWSPIAGSLVDCQASEYLVKFAPTAERDYGAHAKVALQLLQRIAPSTALKFLASHPATLDALSRYLSGDGRDGELGAVVRRADQASTRRALATGSRARFETAVRQPLIEVLMGALRRMLQRGGELPLNRDGAAGWVSDDSVYFVAKRLADAVREHVRKHLPDEAIPGDDKNDRLFDTWQEYGCILPNPATQQAIWHVMVHGEDGEGYTHSLSVLRFPMAKIWDAPEQYPAAMKGRIEVLARRGAPPGAAVKSPGAPTAGSGEPASSADAAAPADPAPLRETARSRAAKPVVAGPKLVRPPNLLANNGPGQKAAAATGTSAVPGMDKGERAEPTPTPDADAGSGSELQTSAAETANRSLVPTAAAASMLQAAKAAPFAADADEYLDDDDDARGEARRRAATAPPTVGRSAPESGPLQAPQPVRLASAAPPLPGTTGASGSKAPSAGAVAFLVWLQAGLASGELRYNAQGAPVHFVPQGMALVSPLIFRLFAQSQGMTPEPSAIVDGEAASGTTQAERFGLDVQREVLRAGWHVPAFDGLNIHKFAVRKRGKGKAGRLSAVVIATPERWLTPVPPPNPALQDWADAEAEVEAL